MEIVQLKGKNGPHQLVVHKDFPPDLPDIYEWNGRSFVDKSNSFPDYYAPLARAEEPMLAYPDRAAPCLYTAAILLERAGRKSEAKTLLTKLLGVFGTKWHDHAEDWRSVVRNDLKRLSSAS